MLSARKGFGSELVLLQIQCSGDRSRGSWVRPTWWLLSMGVHSFCLQHPHSRAHGLGRKIYFQGDLERDWQVGLHSR